MRRSNTKGNIIRVYVIQRHIEQSEIDDVHGNNVDAVLAPCWVAASVEFIERAGYPHGKCQSTDLEQGQDIYWGKCADVDA